jgi:Domain of unknown function (DUF1707)
VTPLPEDSPPLIGEDDRDTAVQRLQEAYTEGLISHEELDGRLHHVLTAKAQSELVSALASLPEKGPGTTSTIAVASGRIQRRGVWRVPRILKVESAFGRVRLDLSQAVIEHPVVDIELRLGTGRAEITVPRDAVVDVGGLRTGWKDLRYKAQRRSRPGGPKIRISGTMGFGRLKIRHARHRGSIRHWNHTCGSSSTPTAGAWRHRFRRAGQATALRGRPPQRVPFSLRMRARSLRSAARTSRWWAWALRQRR